MPRIEITIEVLAPIERCFDLSRSIDFHTKSLEGTGERAIDGVTSGLIGLGEEVTWSARHFGIRQKLTSRITAFERPAHFRDSMVRGAFKRFDHDHYFSSNGSVTVVRDVFDFNSPLGVVGKVFDRLMLTHYMRNLLCERNLVLKRVAESDSEWQRYLR